MNSFSINRFWQVTWWLINVNRVRLLGYIIGIVFATFLIQLMMFVFSSNENVYHYIMSCQKFGTFMIPCMIPITVSWAFTSFTSIGSKQQRGTFLMIPATNLEKFLGVVVYVTVICGLCAIVGYILGDCLRMACLWIVAQTSNDPSYMAYGVDYFNGVQQNCYLWSSTVYRVFSSLTPRLFTVWTSAFCWDWYEWVTFIINVTMAVWIHSLFTLGSTLLRKYTFVVTGLVWLAIMFLFMGSLAHFNLIVTQRVWDGNNKYVGDIIGVMAYVLMVAQPLLSIFNYWASFHIFKGFQLITNKWTNYDFHK